MGKWLIEPIDPLIVRDGRPFGPTPGARARTLPFPFPQTIAGAVRTRDGLDANGRFDKSQENIERVIGLGIRGPLLVELNDDHAVAQFMVPVPADALLLKDGVDVRRRQLTPIKTPSGAMTNLPKKLALVGMSGEPTEEKPAEQAPTFWHWEVMGEWLRSPESDSTPKSRSDLGILKLPSDLRMHVGIKPETQTADEENGALFMTAGLAFQSIPFPDSEALAPELSKAKRYALYVESDAEQVTAGLAPMGGERRMMQWRETTTSLPKRPPEIKAQIARSGMCRVVLATPAYFEDVTRPSYLTQTHHGVTVTVKAVAVSRSETVSGWDFAIGKPKPTRRLAPAGTVLWLTLDGTADQRRAWVESMWLQSISDDYPDGDALRDAAHYRRDGYGLALLGTWDGKEKPWGGEQS